MTFLNSLANVPNFKFGGRRKKTHTQRQRYFEARPLYYKKVSKMRLPDFKDTELEFPINIPLRNVYIFRPVKKRPLTLHHDFLNFKMMSGNEILLYLENPENLRPSEFCSALLELRRKENADKIDWESHPWIQNCVETVKKDSPTYSTQSVSNIITAMTALRIKDEDLWQMLAKISYKIIYNAKGATFGKIFAVYINNPEYSNEDFLKHLMVQLPRFIYKFPPQDFTKAFEATFNSQRLTNYLFNDYFYIYIRQRSFYLGVNYLPRCLTILHKMGYNNRDTELWGQGVVPSLYRIIRERLTEENAPEFIQTLEPLCDTYPFLKPLLNAAKAKQFFLSTVMRSLKDNSFHKQVINDLRFYKEQKLEKLERD